MFNLNRSQPFAVSTRTSQERIRSPTNAIIIRDSSGKANDGSFKGDLGIVNGRPKFTHYTIVLNRLKTFETWPTSKTQSSQDMSMAGFVYTGKNDTVQCFFCGICLKDWPENACPWEQHVIASPGCGHVKLCKGVNFIAKVSRQKNDQHIFDDSDDVIDLVQVAMNRNPVAIEAAREFCSDENQLKQAVKILIKTDPNSSLTAEKLIRIVNEKDAQNENNGDETNDVTSDVIDDPETNEDGSKLDTDADDSDMEEDDDEELNMKLNDSVNCKICFTSKRSVITLPCAHLFCCSQCVSALKECAICRSEITGTVRALMAV